LSNPKIQKGTTMILAVLLVSVLPTMLLTHSHMQLALAQSANQTSSSSSPPPSPASPPPPSPQAMQNTFYAKGVNGILVLDPNAIQGAPPPSKYFGTIVGGNWSLDVVNRSIQNFTMNLLSISPSGAISEAALIDGTANATSTTTGAGGGANATNTAATASNTTTNNNMAFGRSDNDTVLQGTATIAINGTVRWEGVPFAITMTRGTLISVSIDSTRTDNQFGSIPLHGIIMSMTDENGRNLLPGLPYFVSATSNTQGQQQQQFGPPPGSPPGQFSATQADASTNKTCTLTPSLIEVEGTPQQTEGPYFVGNMPNRSDITSDTSNGSVQEGIPLKLVINVYDVDGEGSCIPLKGALVDIWHANPQGIYSGIQQQDTAGQNFLRGNQVTDDNGTVQFTTVYPGWYEGRAIHIHIKVRTSEDSSGNFEWTSQFYLNNSITEQVHTQPPYSDHGQPDMTNEEDGIYTGPSTDGLIPSNAGEHLMLNMTHDDEEGQGYIGTFNVVVNANQIGQ
jgi:protocatechuate 3,4-dioxygenase beta subunit